MKSGKNPDGSCRLSDTNQVGHSINSEISSASHAIFFNFQFICKSFSTQAVRQLSSNISDPNTFEIIASSLELVITSSQVGIVEAHVQWS